MNLGSKMDLQFIDEIFFIRFSVFFCFFVFFFCLHYKKFFIIFFFIISLLILKIIFFFLFSKFNRIILLNLLFILYILGKIYFYKLNCNLRTKFYGHKYKKQYFFFICNKLCTNFHLQAFLGVNFLVNYFQNHKFNLPNKGLREKLKNLLNMVKLIKFLFFFLNYQYFY